MNLASCVVGRKGSSSAENPPPFRNMATNRRLDPTTEMRNKRASRESKERLAGAGPAAMKKPPRSRKSKEFNMTTTAYWTPPRKPSTAELGAARKAFFTIDRDGNGAVDVEELQAMMRSLGQDISKEEAAELILSVDDSKDGKIQFREFLNLYIAGLDAKGKVQNKDVNDCFASFGGDSKDKASRVTSDTVNDTLRSMFDIDVDVSETFGTPRGELSRRDFEHMLSVDGDGTRRAEVGFPNETA